MGNLDSFLAVQPNIIPPLDPDFKPVSIAERQVRRAVDGGLPAADLALGLERQNGARSVHRTRVPDPASGPDAFRYAERWVKYLLWQQGAWRVEVAGSGEFAQKLGEAYSPRGERAFDAQMMEQAYGRPLEVRAANGACLGSAADSSRRIGGHLDGCRIGFDLGASDYKLAAVKDGEPVHVAEFPWDPRAEPDPRYHYDKLTEGLKLAASHLPRVDAIGGSAAGIYLDNEVRVASLFRAVPEERFADTVRPFFSRLREEWGVPLEVANDGDVTALAGGMSLGANGVLGIAMGSSLAAGYLDPAGRITGWLNELAFVPVDLDPGAPVDEWSGDRGCGVQYFSQQAVVRLACKAGIELPDAHPAVQLKHVQELHQKGDDRVPPIFESIGVCLGYALAQFAGHYEFGHVLVLGRVTSGEGGALMVQKAGETLKAEFPNLAETIRIQLPDEKSKRVGQAVAAASLPELRD